jgi:hypothetical protein
MAFGLVGRQDEVVPSGVGSLAFVLVGAGLLAIAGAGCTSSEPETE